MHYQKVCVKALGLPTRYWRPSLICNFIQYVVGVHAPSLFQVRGSLALKMLKTPALVYSPLITHNTSGVNCPVLVMRRGNVSQTLVTHWLRRVKVNCVHKRISLRRLFKKIHSGLICFYISGTALYPKTTHMHLNRITCISVRKRQHILESSKC